MNEPIRINVGGGNTAIPGFVNVDHLTGDEAYPLAVGEWTVPPGYADVIRASHVLEHLSHRITLDVVRNWAACLKPGGVLKVAVPDFGFIVEHAHAENPNDYPLEGWLMGGHVNDDDYHKAVFDREKLETLLTMAGLVDVREWRSEISDCAALPCSLNLMGTKPAADAPAPASAPELPAHTRTPLPGVQAVMTAGRLCFTDQMICLESARDQLRLPVRICPGVFWHQSMATAFGECLAEGAEFVLTIDADTTFAPDDVRELYRLMLAHPGADAVCPVQIGRDRDAVLLTIRDPDRDGKNKPEVARTDLDADLLPIATGHFGLTMLRASALRKLPKPWLWHQPAPDGTWGDGRLDADIHWWRQWEKAGLTLFQANRVPVGHLQLVNTWPDPNLQPVFQYVGDWRANGKPQGAWK